MTAVFLKLVNMSISAAWIVLAVLMLRPLFKKAPKWLSVLLWGIVGLRLVLPVSLESVLSLIPSAETISPAVMTGAKPRLNTGVPILNSSINPIIEGSVTPSGGGSGLQALIPILSYIWIAGLALMLLYTAISFLRLRKSVETAVRLRENIYQCETVASPFILGIIKPKIYLPFNMKGQDAELVIAHEMAHLSRKDQLWKPLGFLLLALHWFNPLMWLAYILLCRDIELACDEKVAGELNAAERADYSEALLSCSVNRRMLAACPLAFGEVGVKERVKNVLNYKKPAFWIIIAAVLICIAAALCFLTNPKDSTAQSGSDLSVKYVSSVSCDETGVNIEVLKLYRDKSGDIRLKVRWDNNSDRTIIYGKTFRLENVRNGNNRDLEAKGGWEYPAYPVLPLSTEDKEFRELNREFEYNISAHYDVKESGTYSFITDFTFEDDRTTSYIVMVQFKILASEPKMSFTIVDRQAEENLPCDTAFEEFYFDDDFIYEFPVIKSQYVEVRYEDGTAENIKHALKNGNVEIKDLDSFGIEYFKRLRKFSDFAPILDSISFDIDGDGKKELLSLGCGPTSGIFTFKLFASEYGAGEYFGLFMSYDFYDLSFDIKDGKLRLKGVTQGENPKTENFDIVIEGDRFALAGDTKSIEYWGEQGLASIYAPKPLPGEQDYFNAEVVSVDKDSIKVRCLEVTKGDVTEGMVISVTKRVINAEGVPPYLKVGDTVRVVYSGVRETYPPQLDKVYAVYLVDEFGNVMPNQ